MQILPTFASPSAQFGSKISRMQELYLRMNMEGVNEVEKMKEVLDLKSEVRNENALSITAILS